MEDIISTLTSAWPYFVGWIVVYAISSRALKRNEIARVKDQLVAKIEKHQDSIIKSVEFKMLNSMDAEFSNIDQVNQTEFYIRQLNYRVGYNLIKVAKLVPIRNIDFKDDSNLRLNYINSVFAELIEDIENSYFHEFLMQGTRDRIGRAFRENRHFYFGIVSGLTILALLFNVLNFIVPL